MAYFITIIIYYISWDVQCTFVQCSWIFNQLLVIGDIFGDTNPGDIKISSILEIVLSPNKTFIFFHLFYAYWALTPGMLRLLLSNSPMLSPQKYLQNFHFWREREGLGGIFYVMFYFVLLFLLPSTFLNKVISCSYRMGGEKIKMFIYFFCWFADDYIVIASLSIYIYVHPILAVEATTCLSIK